MTTDHTKNTLILRMRDTLREIEQHDHETAVLGDVHCLNLKAFMGDHMVHVLRILGEAQADLDDERKRGNALAEDAVKLIAEARRETAEDIAIEIIRYSDEVLARTGADPVERAAGAVIIVGARIAREYAAKEG